MSTHHVRATINGTVYEGDVEARLLLVHWIRDVLRLTGTHTGCDTTSCGACTILVDGKATKSCTMFAVKADGSEIMSGLALLQRNPNPTEHEIRVGISGNLCRCTGYVNIVKAIRYAADKMQASEQVPVSAGEGGE